MDRETHWNSVYANKAEEALTWFEPDAAYSTALIRSHAAPGDPIIDVGGGASRLVDRLLDAGLGPVTVLDLASTALDVSKERLGERAQQVDWAVGDITTWSPEKTYKIWHDRAVFHFLRDPAAQKAYCDVVSKAIAPGGVVIMMTFAEDGPEACSNLPVQRYSSATLAGTFEANAPGQFEVIKAEEVTHITPKGSEQKFQTTVFLRKGGEA